MKIYRIYYIYVIIGIAILSLYLIFKRNNDKLIEINNEEILVETKFENDWLLFNLYFNNKYEGKLIDNFICETSDNSTLQLSKIVLDKPILFFRYSYSNCNTCYEEEINLLNEVFKNNIGNAIIISSYDIKRDYLKFLNFIKSDIPIYRILNDSNLKIETNNPYYFLLHEDLKMTHFFIPDKKYPEKSKEYLEKIIRVLD